MTTIYKDGKALLDESLTAEASVLTTTVWIRALAFSRAVLGADTLIAGDVVQLRGLNTDPETQPADADIGHQIGADITADTIAVFVETLPVWVKVIKSANAGGGATNAYLLLRARSGLQ